jgi:Flp pilus assembly pilin Flp
VFDTTRVLFTMLANRWRLVRSDEGATAVEYAVILGLAFVAAGIVAGLIVSIVKAHTAGLS